MCMLGWRVEGAYLSQSGAHTVGMGMEWAYLSQSRAFLSTLGQQRLFPDPLGSRERPPREAEPPGAHRLWPTEEQYISLWTVRNQE